MKLVDADLELGKIWMDPFNPRFSNPIAMPQNKLISEIFSTQAAKELLKGMQINIKWVNKIVVLKKEDFSDEQKSIPDIDKCEYLVVEGNTRLACLKSGKIAGFESSTKIPVLIAEREVNENRDEFESQIRVTQGIANVMVVKEWSPISKARHLYKMFFDLKKRNGGIRPNEIYKKISTELGIGIHEVRQAVIRYQFFFKINEISDSIPESQWGYLEAFDKNKEIRTKFGMSPDSDILEISQDSEGITEEILQEIPSLIRKAVSEGINSKRFRDIITEKFKSVEDRDIILEQIQAMANEEDGNFSFATYESDKKNISDRDTWINNIKKVKDILQTFPTMASWASEMKKDLEEIAELINRHLKAWG